MSFFHSSNEQDASIRSARMQGWLAGSVAMIAILGAAAGGYWFGQRWDRPAAIEVLQAATAATGTNMAVATGAVSDDAEGVFFLDFLTGDLQCLVYYPRTAAFGARYYTNVLTQLPSAGKNSQYLLVTGGAVSSRAAAGARPGNSLVYVTDATSGNFAAYAVPWDRTSEGASRAQAGPLVFVGGGPVRNYQVRDSRPNTSNNPGNNAVQQPAKAPAKQDDKPGDKQAKPAKGVGDSASDAKKKTDLPSI